MDEIRLIRLVEIYAAARSWTPGRACRHHIGDAKIIARLRAGHTCTLRIANDLISRISADWPLNTEWPPDIPRPAPSPDAAPNSRTGGTPPPRRPHPAGPRAELSPTAGVASRGEPSTAAPGPSGDGEPNPPAGGRVSRRLPPAPADRAAGVAARGGTQPELARELARPAASLKREGARARSRRKAAASAGRATPAEAA